MGKHKVRNENKKRNQFLKNLREKNGLLAASEESKRQREQWDGVAEDEVDQFDLDKDQILLSGTKGPRQDESEER